jgi:DNA-directed RNA polymerase subunit K/omega
MNPILLARASASIPETTLLVNIVRQRVRQLLRGHRPLVAVPPGMGLSDVALSEIAEKKLTSAPNTTFHEEARGETIIGFPTKSGLSTKAAA